MQGLHIQTNQLISKGFTKKCKSAGRMKNQQLGMKRTYDSFLMLAISIPEFCIGNLEYESPIASHNFILWPRGSGFKPWARKKIFGSRLSGFILLGGKSTGLFLRCVRTQHTNKSITSKGFPEKCKSTDRMKNQQLVIFKKNFF